MLANATSLLVSDPALCFTSLSTDSHFSIGSFSEEPGTAGINVLAGLSFSVFKNKYKKRTQCKDCCHLHQIITRVFLFFFWNKTFLFTVFDIRGKRVMNPVWPYINLKNVKNKNKQIRNH